MSMEQAYNFLRIDERVASAGVVNEEQLATLAASGIEAVINLLPDSSEYAVATEMEIIAGQGLEYLYIPVDFANPTEQDFSAFVRALEQTAAKNILIHCAANWRVSAFYAIYAFENLGWTREQAQTHIASIWNPEEHPPWQQFIAGHLYTGNDQ